MGSDKMNINTKYGVLKNCQEVTYHENGALATAFTHELFLPKPRLHHNRELDIPQT